MIAMKISSLLKVEIFHPEQQKASDDLFLARMKHVHTAMSFPWEWLRTQRKELQEDSCIFFFLNHCRLLLNSALDLFDSY